jgi:hypothetical protein
MSAQVGARQGGEGMMEDVAARFFARHLELEPEEAGTLGFAGGARALRPMGPEADERRLAHHRDCVRALSEAEPAPAGSAAETDARVLLRHARLEAHLLENGYQPRDPQWALYPYVMLRYEMARRGLDAEGLAELPGVRERLRALGEYLEGHRRDLRAWRERGSVAHRSLITRLGAVELPRAAAWLAPLDTRAAAHLREHATFLLEELLPAAAADGVLGSEEFRRRFALTFGAPCGALSGGGWTPESAAATAREELARTQDEIVRLAEPLGAGATGWPAVVAFLGEAQKETLPPACDVPARYHEQLHRIVLHCRATAEFPAVEAEAVALGTYPEAMRDAGPGTNWPAPLRGGDGRAHFVLHPDPAAHAAAWLPVLAVHEGLPGHALQSLIFRQGFGDHPAPVRFLAVADDVALCRQNFVAMPAIEGWAVHAEERMRASGLHEGRDRLFASVAHALRQVRVLAEIALHDEGRPPEEVARFIAREAGLPDGRSEVARYQRGPLQALTYALGAAELRRARERSGESWAVFHERVLGAGPVPPDLL